MNQKQQGYDSRLLKPSRKTIYLDLDGVLGNFNDHYKEFARIFTSHNNQPNHSVIHALDNKDPSFWRWIDKFGSKFWSTMPWTPWGKELYYYCVQMAPTVILTSPSNNPSSTAGKHDWLNKEVGNRNWAISGCKWAFANPNTLLIDDTPKKVNKFKEAGGNVFLFTGETCLEECKLAIENFVKG